MRHPGCGEDIGDQAQRRGRVVCRGREGRLHGHGGQPGGEPERDVTAFIGTIVTMTAVVLLGIVGVSKLATPLARFERYGHALAGFVVLACGAAIKLGL